MNFSIVSNKQELRWVFLKGLQEKNIQHSEDHRVDIDRRFSVLSSLSPAGKLDKTVQL